MSSPQPLSLSSNNLAQTLPLNTAINVDFYVGPTGLSLGIALSKAGGGFAGWAGAVTETANGWYKLAFTSGDLNTQGSLALHADGGSTNVLDVLYEVAAPVKLGDKMDHGGTPGSSAATMAMDHVNFSGTSGQDAFALSSDTGYAFSIAGGTDHAAINVSSGSNAAGMQISSDGAFHDIELTGSGDILGNLNGYILGASSPTFTGNGVQASVPGAVGSVTGNVGGNVTGNVGGNVTGTTGGMTAAGWAGAFTVNSTKVYADAVTGSVVKEIANNGNVTKWLGATIVTPNVAGVPIVDTKFWLGGLVPTPSVTGVPIIDLKYILGTGMTETGAGYLATAFKTFFNVNGPVLTTASVNQTGDSFARLGAPVLASISADVAAVRNQVTTDHGVGSYVDGSSGGTVSANVTQWNGNAVTDTDSGFPDVTVRGFTADGLAPLGYVHVEPTLPSQSGMTTTQVKLNVVSGFTYADNGLIGAELITTDTTGRVQSRPVVSYTQTGSAGSFQLLIVVNEAWTIQPALGDAVTLRARVNPAVEPFLTNSGYLYANAVTGSEVKEIATHAVGGSGLDAAGVRAAVGLATANLDTQLGGIQSDTDNLQTRVPAALVGGRMDSYLGAGVNVVRNGTAQAGTLASITLDSGASAVNDFYNGELVNLVSGTGAGQTRVVTSYTGSSKVATIDRLFKTAPDNTSVFSLLAAGSPALNDALQVSAGIATTVIRSGTAQAGSTSTTIKLDSGASATSNLYSNNLVAITGGTGAGQTRTIISYVGSTKVATVDRAWVVTPDNTSTFDIYASTTPSLFSDQGVAQAGALTTITLASSASSVDSVYNGSLVTILSGTGAGQTQPISAYVGSTRVATVPMWNVIPDSTSAYAVIPTVSGSGTTGTTDVNVVTVAGVSQTGADLGALLNSIQADTDNIQTRLPTALVGGRMDASVGAMAADVLTSSALATSAVTEIAGQITTDHGVGSYVDTGTGLDAAGIRAAVGLASANLDTQLSGIQSDTNDIQTRLPAALIGGHMDSIVEAMEPNTLTASALATDAVAEIAAKITVDHGVGSYVDTGGGGGGGMSFSRTPGVFLGTDETTGVSLAAGGSLTSVEVDVLGDNASIGEIVLYSVITAPAGDPRNYSISIASRRVTGVAYTALTLKVPQVTAAGGATARTELGRLKIDRFLTATIKDEGPTVGSPSTVAVLYTLEKTA